MRIKKKKAAAQIAQIDIMRRHLRQVHLTAARAGHVVIGRAALTAAMIGSLALTANMRNGPQCEELVRDTLGASNEGKLSCFCQIRFRAHP